MAFIKVVIKIPEADYKFIKETEKKEPSNLNYIARKILTGTVLPKGHGRLIDADAVLEDPIGNTYKDIEIAETIIEADEEEDQ